MRTVEEMFSEEQITKDHVQLVADESEYWERASRFVLDNWNFPVEHLTIDQNKWLGKIFDDMTEMRIEKASIFNS